MDEVVGKVERFEKYETASPVIEIDGMFFVVVLMDALNFHDLDLGSLLGWC